MGLPVVRTGNVALDRFLEQVRQFIEAHKEAPAQARDRVLRMSDLQHVVDLAAAGAAQRARHPDSMEQFARDLAATQLFKSLMGPGSALDGLVDGIPRVEWNNTGAKRDGRSSAQASTNAIVAAEDNRAVAALVTDVTARLDNFYDDGSPGIASIEQAFLALADAKDGLMAQYTVKVRAGGAIAGFGLAATEKDGVPSSAFIISADKFALVSPYYTGGLTNTPPSWAMPFGVDSSTNPPTLYLNGQVRINTQAKGVRLDASSFIYNTSDGSPGTITVTATRQGGLEGAAPVFKRGSTVLPGTGYSRTINMAGTTAGFVVTVTVTETVDGKTYTYEDSIGIGVTANGAHGAPGSPGTRGSVRTSAIASSWSDTAASNAIAALGLGAPVIGDEVTLRNSTTNPTFVKTKYWSGFAWADPGVVIDGNLLVKGTVSTDALAANSVWSRQFLVESTGWAGSDVSITYRSNVIGMKAPSSVSLTASSSAQGFVGHSGVVRGTGYYKIGVHGGVEGAATSGGAAVGVHGHGKGPGTIGGAFYGGHADIALYGTGRILWGAVLTNAPNGSSSTFLRGDGQWSADPIRKGQPVTITIPAQGGSPQVVFTGCTIT